MWIPKGNYSSISACTVCNDVPQKILYTGLFVFYVWIEPNQNTNSVFIYCAVPRENSATENKQVISTYSPGTTCIKTRFMMTSSNWNIFRVTGPLCGEFNGPGEFPPQRPVTRSFDVFFDLRLNKRLSKQPWGWWFETPSWSSWRHCNVTSTLSPLFQYKTRMLKCHDTTFRGIFCSQFALGSIFDVFYQWPIIPISIRLTEIYRAILLVAFCCVEIRKRSIADVIQPVMMFTFEK